MRKSNPIEIVDIVRNWYREATERRELLAMDDRMLRDVGITRLDAVAAARRPLWRRHTDKAPVRLKVDPETIQRHVEEARELRIRAMAGCARSAWRWLTGKGAAQPKARIRKLAPVAR